MPISVTRLGNAKNFIFSDFFFSDEALSFILLTMHEFIHDVLSKKDLSKVSYVLKKLAIASSTLFNFVDYCN